MHVLCFIDYAFAICVGSIHPFCVRTCPSQTAFVSLDKGFSAETGADLANYVALPAILSAMPSSASILVSAYCNDTTGVNAGGGLPIKLFAKGE